MKWVLSPEDGLYLRRLVPADAEAVSALAGRAFDSAELASEVRAMLDVYCQAGAESVPLDLQTGTMLPVSYYVLARQDTPAETRIGLTGLYRPVWAGEGVYWLGWFAVDPAFHGHGYGRRLLQASLTLAATRGGRLLCVETSDRLDTAVALYHRLGFRRCGSVPDYWAPGLAMVILARPLDDIPTCGEIPYGF